MNNLGKFLNFEAVILIKNPIDWMNFVKKMKTFGLTDIKYLAKLNYYDLHCSAGRQRFDFGDLCVEYYPGKGFTVGAKKSYESMGLQILNMEEIGG